MHQDGSDSGIDAAAEGANHPAIPCFRSNGRGGFFDEGRATPLFFRFANAKEKIAEDLCTAVRMADFRMKLDGVNFAVRIFDGGDGAVCAANGAEAGWESNDVIAVAIPDAQGLGKLGEELGLMGGVLDVQYGAAIFAAFGRFDLSAQVMGEPLHAVADSQHGDSEGEDIYITLWRLGIVNRTGTAGKDDARRFEFADFVERGGAWEHRGEDLLFADAAGD